MPTNRRKFIKDFTALGVLTSTYPLFTACNIETAAADYLEEKINRIELYRYDIDIPRYFSWGTWYNRQHLFMKISSGDFYGWSEIPAKVNTPDFMPTKWIKYLSQFKGMTLDEAQTLLAKQQLPGTMVSTKELEFIEMGLIDLAGKLQNKPAVELLNLEGRQPVAGLYCILDKDIEKVKEEAHNSIEQNLAHHLKFKMYGDKALDLKLLKIVRDILGEKSVIISDVNNGYKKWKSLEELAATLIEYRDNGLSAIEDPSALSIEEWIQLQKMIGSLSLIPDVAMRPAWEGIKNIKSGMGNIFNLHPSTMGSFKLTAQMANKIKAIDCKVMIGDDSLVGPACSAWQQIAVGAGAVWVEAIEKKEDSKNYMDCLISAPTKKDHKGYYALNPSPGFGVELDTAHLKKICKLYIEV